MPIVLYLDQDTIWCLKERFVIVTHNEAEYCIYLSGLFDPSTLAIAALIQNAVTLAIIAMAHAGVCVSASVFSDNAERMCLLVTSRPVAILTSPRIPHRESAQGEK
jgi:hypothetical protein